MRERNGVGLGVRVRDLDGKELGRVAKLYEWAFLVVKGPPVLARQETVIRYDEVRGLRDGRLVVSRSDRQLFELAAGELPSSWIIPTRPDFPSAATPPEARGVFETFAAERREATRPAGDQAPKAGADEPTLSPDEERESYRQRGEPLGSAPSSHP